MEKWQKLVYDAICLQLDESALYGKEIRKASLPLQLFNCRADVHKSPIQEKLNDAYNYLSALAKHDKRLSENDQLVKQWKLTYDIFSPKLLRFIEVDERQHFSYQRIRMVSELRKAGSPPLYHPFFWKEVIPRFIKRPAIDNDPPWRDEARAYRDYARDILPQEYGLKPTIRLDIFSLDEYGVSSANLTMLIDELLLFNNKKI